MSLCLFLINAHLLEYLCMLCLSLAVQSGCLVHLTQLLLGLTELTLEVLHQLLVTSVLTLSQITLSFGYLLLTTDIPVCVCEREREREGEMLTSTLQVIRIIISLLDNLPQLLGRFVTRSGCVSEHRGHALSSLVLNCQQPS